MFASSAALIPPLSASSATSRAAPLSFPTIHASSTTLSFPPATSFLPRSVNNSAFREGRTRRAAAAFRTFAKLDGAVVNVELLRYPRGGVAPVGRVIEILGRPGDLRRGHRDHDSQASSAAHFHAGSFARGRRLALPVTEADRAGRDDFRDLPIVTIDGETARDFDDAVYVERREDGDWQLQVHIADVAHYVRPGSALDREARLRGNFGLFPDRAVPMLPGIFSNGICSLNPQEDRLVMSAIMEFDAAGRMTNSLDRARRHSLRRAHDLHEREQGAEGDPEMTARYAHLNHHFRDMRDWRCLLNARRARTARSISICPSR